MNYSDLDIVFMTKIIPSYLQDALFYGLHQLGCNVVDYPVKPSLHGTPHPSEFHSEQILFHLPKNKLRKKNPDILIITAQAQDYNPAGPYNWSRHVIETIERLKPEKTVMLDTQDSQAITYPPVKKDYDAIFKRELKKIPDNNWYLINYAAILEPFLFRFYPTREYDFSFIASISNDYRVKVADFLKELTKKYDFKSYIHCERYHIPRTEYLEVLSQSKASISVRGMGRHCYRYFEIPSKGTIMISDDIGFPIENDFRENIDYFKFKDLEQLEHLLIKLKKTPDEIKQNTALTALQHTLNYHTPEKRAKQFLKKIFYK